MAKSPDIWIRDEEVKSDGSPSEAVASLVSKLRSRRVNDPGSQVTSRIRYKTPEELAQQLYFIDLNEAIYNSFGIKLPPEVELDPIRFIESVRNRKRNIDKLKITDEEKEELSREDEYLGSYYNYIYEIKSAQRRYKKKTPELMKSTQPCERRLGGVRAEVLEKMSENTLSSIEQFSITKQERVTLASSEELFKSESVRLLRIEPVRIWKSIGVAMRLLPEQELKSLILSTFELDGNEFLIEFNSIQHLFESEEKKNLIRRAMTANRFPFNNLQAFAEQKLYRFFTPEEYPEIIRGILRDYVNVKGYENRYVLQLIEAGVLKQQDLVEFIEKRLKVENPHLADEVLVFKGMEIAEDDWERIRSALKKGFLRQSRPFKLSNLQRIQEKMKVFSYEEMREIVLHRIGTDSGVRFSLNIVFEHLSREEIAKVLNEKLLRRDPEIIALYFNQEVRKRMPEFTTDEENERIVRDLLIDDEPGDALEYLDFVLEGLEGERRKNLVLDLAKRADVNEAVMTMDRWLPVVSKDEATQREIVLQILRDGTTHDYAGLFIGDHWCEKNWWKLFRKLVSKVDIASALENIDNLDESMVGLSLDDVYKIFDENKARMREYYERIFQKYSRVLLGSLGYAVGLLEKDEMVELIWRYSDNESLVSSVLTGLDDLGKVLDKGFLSKYVERVAAKFPEVFCMYLVKCMPLIEIEKREELLRGIIRRFPYLGLKYYETVRKFVRNITKEDVRKTLKSDPRLILFWNNGLRSRLKVLMADSADSKSIKIALSEVGDVYDAVRILEDNGVWDLIMVELASCDVNERLNRLYMYQALYLARGVNDSIEEFRPITVEMLEQEINKIFGIDSESSGRYSEATLASMVPFMVYLNQYRHSPTHMRLLKEMWQSIQQGQEGFLNWKFGKDVEQFEEMKLDGLLPAKLTWEQYQIFRNGVEKEYQVAMEVKPEEVAERVRNIIIANAQEHLGIDRIEQMLGREAKCWNNVARIGGRIGHEFRDRSPGRGNAIPDDIVGLIDERDLNKAQYYLLRLCKLSESEILSGYLLSDLGKKQKKLSHVIDFLKLSYGSEGQMVINQVADALLMLSLKNYNAQYRLEVKADFKTLMEIGSMPVVTCQDYRHGSHNSSLIGTLSNPFITVSTVKEEADLVARSLIILSSDGDGSPVIFCENSYSKKGLNTVDRLNLLTLLDLAEAMGISLYTKFQLSVEDVEDGFSIGRLGFERTAKVLVGKASRSDEIYLDAAGGEHGRVVKGGKYKLQGLYRVTRLF